MTGDDNDRLLTVAEIAAILRVNHNTVRRWITNGLLEAVLLPKAGTRETYRVRRSDLEKLLQAGNNNA